ncbi:MAG: hypothetical protein HN353_13070 [Bdellovibrionales bacterium]|jgi:hypothetical protein|nr:hypothetical protein [Bdellovibrionales bacterium]MBT3524978.1 hypothetical protein [Bdellovibrionales bacterium]MBT7670362.1 hypothetical protein [Bdellovibrionales bacterium]MBT7766666.1 hypothetical protein [Bdellovibrionales bacterium]
MTKAVEEFKSRLESATHFYFEIREVLLKDTSDWLKIAEKGSILSTRPKAGEYYKRACGLNIIVAEYLTNQIYIFELKNGLYKIQRTEGANREVIIFETTVNVSNIQEAVKLSLQSKSQKE